jgi:hypothetical protein
MDQQGHCGNSVLERAAKLQLRQSETHPAPGLAENDHWEKLFGSSILECMQQPHYHGIADAAGN